MTHQVIANYFAVAERFDEKAFARTEAHPNA